MNTKPIYILVMNEFFDSVKSNLPDNYKVVYPVDLNSYSSDIQGIMTTPWSKVDSELICGLPNLKIISCFGVGIDAVDRKKATEKRIIITNTPDIVADDTADIGMALVLCLSRKIIANDYHVKSNKWPTSSHVLCCAQHNIF